MRQPEDGGRPARQAAEGTGQRQLAVVIEFQRQGQQGFQADDAGRRLGEGQALAFDVLGIVARGDQVQRTVGEAGDDGAAVFFHAQRWRRLGEGAVGADGRLVQGEAVDQGAGAHPETGGLGVAQGVDRLGGRECGGVIAPAGERGEPQVAFHHDGLRLAGDAGEAKPHAKLTLVHHPVGGQRRVLGILADDEIEGVGIGQAAAHDAGIGYRPHPVGERHGARLGEQAELGHLPPGDTLGEGRHRVYPDPGGIPRQAGHVFDQRDVVDHRIGIRHGQHGGDAAGDGGLAGAREGFAMLGTGLTDEDPGIDQAGRQDPPAAIDRKDAVRQAVGE